MFSFGFKVLIKVDVIDRQQPSRVRSKCVFLKTNVLTLFKLGQMTHLMTSNENIFNTKLLEPIKIYI